MSLRKMMNSENTLSDKEKMAATIQSYLFIIYKVNLCIENIWKSTPQLLTAIMEGVKNNGGPTNSTLLLISSLFGYFLVRMYSFQNQ